MTTLQDKTAVVIGGTSGIGLATARLLVDAGARVTIAGHDPDKGARRPRACAMIDHTGIGVGAVSG